MFTGIIESVGRIKSAEPKGGDTRFVIDAGKLDMGDVALGDSIACNGICLTVIEFDKSTFVADVSNETLSVTCAKNYRAGQRLNLEKALTPTTRLGGHLVSGHVDGIGQVIERHDDARSVRFTIEAPVAIQHYIAHKGSITVDGTSLTVNAVEGNRFKLNIVPHTLQETIMGDYQAGTRVNLEVDLLARYLERLLTGRAVEAASSGISRSFLAEHGFLKG